jgi:hypothetical protein
VLVMPKPTATRTIVAPTIFDLLLIMFAPSLRNVHAFRERSISFRTKVSGW